MGKWCCSRPHSYPPSFRWRGKTRLPAESLQARRGTLCGCPGAQKPRPIKKQRRKTIPNDCRSKDHIFGAGVMPVRPHLKPAAVETRRVKPNGEAELIRGQQGAAALEFALVAPLFLLLWFGILDFGLAMYAKGLITHASQEGARYGTIYHLSPPTNGEIQGYVQSYLRGAGFSEPVTITVTGAGGPAGAPLTVRVDYTYHFLALPGFLAGLADSFNLSAEAVKRLE